MSVSKSYRCTFELWRTDALVGVDEVPAGGIVLARRRQTLVVLLLAIQAVVTFTGHTITTQQTSG